VISNVVGELPPSLLQRVEGLGIPFLGQLPHDPAVGACDLEGRPLVELGDDSLIYPAIKGLLRKALP